MRSRPIAVIVFTAAFLLVALLLWNIPPGGATGNVITSSSAAGKIVFTSDRDSNNEIYVMNADGSGQTRLTNNPANDTQPVWSPDGTQIAFASDRDDPASGACPAPFGCEFQIYVMDADGSNQTRLTNNPGESASTPAWSHDGTRIAFTAKRSADVYAAISFVNADGSGLTQVTDPQGGGLGLGYFGDAGPSWSPDDQQLVFVGLRSYKGYGTIYVVNVDGSDLLELLPAVSGKGDLDPDWSPDGSSIAYSSRLAGVRDELDIYVLSFVGAGNTSLTDQGANDSAPAWSPDGTQIAFTSDRDGNDEIYVMSDDGSGQTNLTNNAAGDSLPDWLPLAPTPTPVGQTPSPTPVPGDVSGSVFNDANGDSVRDGGESGIPGATVCVFAVPSLQCATSGPIGEYSFTVPSGPNIVSAFPVPLFMPTTDLSETVVVPPAGIVADVDFGFRTPLPVPPEVDLGGCVQESGGITVVFWGCALVVEKDVTDHCGADQPQEVTLLVRFPFSLHAGVMTRTAGASELWTYTVPVGVFIPGSASLEFYVDCPPDTVGFPADLSLIGPEDEIQFGGDIYIDPSGTIEDACTGTPVEGATVRLLLESPGGSGTFVTATTGLIPSTNPQVTAADGLYGWMTVAGVYKIRVEKAGYDTVESSELSIPPAVTDLMLALIPTGGCPTWTWGDANCSGAVDPVDSLLTLRFDAGLSTNTGDCPDFGQVVDVQNASPHLWGDVDCGGDITPVDSLKLLRYDAGLSIAAQPGCPAIGEAVTTSAPTPTPTSEPTVTATPVSSPIGQCGLAYSTGPGTYEGWSVQSGQVSTYPDGTIVLECEGTLPQNLTPPLTTETITNGSHPDVHCTVDPSGGPGGAGLFFFASNPPGKTDDWDEVIEPDRSVTLTCRYHP